MSEIRIANFFKLTVSKADGALNDTVHRYQNYFINGTKSFASESYNFAPFRADGAIASLGGDNQQLTVLFPGGEVAIRLIEEGNGNRLTVLELTTIWLTASGDYLSPFTDYFIGAGATFNEDTVELRFRSSMDSVGSNFPARTLTVDNVGILPLNAELTLR
jgi:hypothetical protein